MSKSSDMTSKTPRAEREGDSLNPFVRRSVRNPRYSLCGSANLDDLDWDRGWWTDTSFGGHYLHVWNKDGETIHRVYCRGHECPRLEMKRGKLMWLYLSNK